MLIKIDIESDEFKKELKKTKKFTNKVCKQFDFVYNPEDGINESVQMGLARNKMIYGTRYCPCFMVEGSTKEEQKEANNRICPCKPALENEIPKTGKCHCGIFCTKEFAKQESLEQDTEDKAHSHSQGLSKQECEVLLHKEQLDSDEIIALLEARELGFVEFNLVDVREWMEWKSQRIKGTDFLVPTTSFYEAVSQLEDAKDTPVILYCLTGSRSAYCQNVMNDMGFKQVSNFTYGIIAYNGDIVSGE